MNRRRFCAAAGAGVLLAGCKSLPKPDGGPVRVFIIHGYGATVADHWFPWLAQQLRRRGMEVVPVPLPDSQHPDYGRWQDALARTVGMPSGRAVLVAHSLGTVSLLHYLSRIRPHKIGGLVLVSAFGARIPTLPKINGFDVDGYVDRCPIDFAAVTITSCRRKTPAVWRGSWAENRKKLPAAATFWAATALPSFRRYCGR